MSNKPNIEHIYTFIKVVESGSFTAAAEALSLSKSVVSKHVSSLEEVLQAQLLKRTTRRLHVTDMGRTFYEQVKNIPYEIAHAQQSIQPFQDEPRGVLRVISPLNFVTSLKLEVVPNYLTQYPHVEMDFRAVRPAIDYVNDEYDVIILWKLQHESFPDYNLQSMKLFSMPLAVYATPDYLEQHGTPQTPSDLKSHNCFSSIGRHWPFCEKSGEVYSIETRGRLHTNNDEIIQAACLSGTGIAFSYPFLFYKALQKRQVVPVLQDYTNVFIELYAFYHPTSYLPPKIGVFLDQMRAYYQAHQDEILQRGQV